MYQSEKQKIQKQYVDTSTWDNGVFVTNKDKTLILQTISDTTEKYWIVVHSNIEIISIDTKITMLYEHGDFELCEYSEKFLKAVYCSYLFRKHQMLLEELKYNTKISTFTVNTTTLEAKKKALSIYNQHIENEITKVLKQIEEYL